MTDILISAFLLSAVLLGIHSYFGINIIKRGIIFTDLAVGQMAALGAAISILFLDGRYIYLMSLTFAFIGGLIIAISSRENDTLEAFIGLLYAFGISGVFILLSKSYHGMETFQKLMAADILFTPREEILRTAVLYSALGLFIYLFYNRTSGFLREIFFFLTFSITVTISVKLAGVLTVFALLVSPALISLKLGWRHTLINAWIIGTLVNLLAIIVSHVFDFPTGYMLVFFHALGALVVCFLRPKIPAGGAGAGS